MSHEKLVRTVSLAALAIAAAASGAEAYAQTPEQAQIEQERTDVIIVTAQKREERLQDVPISIRAIGETEIARLGESNLQALAGLAPSMAIVEQGPSRNQINMRGVSTGDLRLDRPEFRETVGLYLDETPISTQIVSPNLGMLDIQRVEVLRGPQGTLYGAGSLSGTIRMITNRPDLSEASGSLAQTFSVTDNGGNNYLTEGLFNLPIVEDQLGIRGVGYYRTEDGFIDNSTTGENNFNDVRDYAGRLSVRAVPTDQLTLDASVVHQNTEQGGEFSYRAEAGDLIETTGVREPTEGKMTIANLTASYDFGPVSLTSVTSYFDKDSSFVVGAGLYSDFVSGFTDNVDGTIDTDFRQRETTQELRLSSNADSSLSYTLGLFYQKQDNGFGQSLDYPGLDAVNGVDSTSFGANVDEIFFSDIQLDTTQYAAFGEVRLELTDDLAVTAGGRYFDVSQDSRVLFLGSLSGNAAPAETPFQFQESGFNPKVNVTYTLGDDSLIYAQAAKGFRLGGTNQPFPDALCGLPSSLPSFESDSLWNYELGAKTSWMDGRLIANGAIYQIDWENPPLAADFACGFSTIVNAGSFVIRGAELDLQFSPTSDLTLRGGGAYTDGQLDGDLPRLGGIDGDRIPQTPTWTFNGSIDYDFPVAGTEYFGFFHADWRYVGERDTLFPGNTNISGFFELPEYQIVGLRAGVDFGNTTLEAFVDNALDERAFLNQTNFVRAFDERPGSAIFTNRPRTIGVKLGAHF